MNRRFREMSFDSVPTKRRKNLMKSKDKKANERSVKVFFYIFAGLKRYKPIK
jgi:hypothetical protein